MFSNRVSQAMFSWASPYRHLVGTVIMDTIETLDYFKTEENIHYDARFKVTRTFCLGFLNFGIEEVGLCCIDWRLPGCYETTVHVNRSSTYT